MTEPTGTGTAATGTASTGTAGTDLAEDEVRRVLETAVHAPSVHNTQPWRFSVDGRRVSVFADWSRSLPQQDPEGRELLISCGAATLHALLGLRGLGLGAVLTWLPRGDHQHPDNQHPDNQDPAHQNLVAELVATGPEQVTSAEQALVAAVPLRHTDRSAFTAEPVPDDLIGQLRRVAEQQGCWLWAPERADDVVELEVLASRADRLHRQDAGLHAELSAWVRPDERPADGVPSGALPGHGQGRGSSLPLRDFAPVSEGDTGGTESEPPAAERPLLLVLGTTGDSPEQWLQAGAALAAVLLTATAAGLVANPQTAVLEVPSLRQQLASRLGLVGQPQLLLRVGWPAGSGSPQTGRRPVEDVLREPGPAH